MKKFFSKTWIGILALATIVVGACCSHKDTPGASKQELKDQLNALEKRIKEREMSCVYGSPEVMESYRQETARLRQEADSLQHEIDKLEKK